MDEAAHLEILVSVTLNLAQQRHIYPQGLLKRLTEAQAAIVRELVCYHTPRPEWLADWGKREDAIQAAAKDPVERVRIAKLAAEARWRGHVKKKRTLKERIDDAIDNDGNNFRLKRLPRSAIRKYGLPPLKKNQTWAVAFGHGPSQHARNEHGNTHKEQKQKQHSIKREDLHFLVHMIAYPDIVSNAKDGKQGQKRFRIERKRNGKRYIAVVQVSRKRSALIPVTFYIKRK